MPSSDKPLRAAWYSRVSSETQAEAVTIDLQRDFAKKFFAYHQEMILVETYEDNGVSGAIPVAERPGGKRLLADAKAHKFDVIVFYSFDRIVRSTLDLLQFHQTLEKIGVALRSASQPFDTTTHFGKAFMTMLGMIAELERHQIRDRTTRGKLRTVQKGGAPGGTPAFGYRWENQIWVIDEEEAKVVRLIYKMIAQGSTVMDVMRWLIAHNIPTIKEGRGKALSRWQESVVLRMVHNPIYRGVFYFNTTKSVRGENGKQRRIKRPESEWVSVQVPPIVDEETWYTVQAVIESHKTLKKGNFAYDYLLKGLLKCDLCGQTYQGTASTTQIGSTRYFYYRHSVSNRSSATPKCPGHRLIRAEKLEAAVWQDIERFLREPERFLGRLRTRLQIVPATPAPTDLDIQALIEQKTAARASIINMLARSRITEEEAERDLMQLEGELRELEAERDALAEQAFNNQRLEASLLEAGHVLEQLRQGVDDPGTNTKRDIIKVLVREIRVIPGEGRTATFEIGYRLDSLGEATPFLL